MSSETAIVAEQCRLREWAAQIRGCQRHQIYYKFIITAVTQYLFPP